MVNGPFLMRTSADGSRTVGWRMWLLVWLLPVTMLAGGAVELGWQNWALYSGVRVMGTVERVYQWQNDIPFSDAPFVYTPVFRYTEPDGSVTGASSHMRDPSLGFEVGSQHEIVIFPGQDRDVMVPGTHVYVAGRIVMALGLALCLPAMLVSLLLRRWKRHGKD